MTARAANLLAATDLAPGFEGAFAEIPEERSEIPGLVGTLPDFLRGAYYVNGPARFRRGAFRYRHWLDGDGMVCSLRFTDDGVRFVSRFVRSTKLLDEEAAGRPMYRTFGTRFDGDQLLRGVALASPVNVSVYPYRETLLAFGEQGLPWELDPLTLETRDPFTFAGALTPISPFAAHPKIDAQTGELFNFGVSFSERETTLNFYCFDSCGELRYRRRLPLPQPYSIHDFALGPRWAAFYLSPYLLDMAALRSGRTVIEALSWHPERGSRLLLVHRATGDVAADVPLGDQYCLHTINSFAREEQLIVDVVELDAPVYDQYQPVPDLFTAVPAGRPVRYTIDVPAAAVTERITAAANLAPDFPSIDQRRQQRSYRDFWFLNISRVGWPGRKFFDQLVHAEWLDAGVRTVDVYQAPAGT